MSALDKCFWGYGYAWNSLSHYDDDVIISNNNENHNSLRASSPLKEYREWQAKGEARAGAGKKKMRARRFLRLSRLHRSLVRSLATRNGEVATSP